MKVPVSWLREYVTFEDTPEGLAEKLTFSGTEVEAIHRFGADCSGVVAGQVLEINPHPNADRLQVCRVTDGTDTLQVVCGAPDVEVGGIYPLARVGALLKGSFCIKPTTLRGVESCGMLCAEDELGLSDDHTGLMRLPPETPPGVPLEDVVGPPDVVLELEITPNRPDCLSILGIAREVAALYGTCVNLPETPLQESGPPAEACTSVELLDAERCPRYTARILRDARIAPSPAWMQRRLEQVGIRPINNVVDITNYVMMECGQPLHAFDQKLLEQERIIVRTALPGETITTLDDAERPLHPDMLVIADARHPVALAGVMGGAGSEISTQTSTILLESACFDPRNIRTTSRKTGLSTDSSYRFERGVDIDGVDWASRRAASLMQQHAQARVATGVVDVFPAPPTPRTLECRLEKINALLGLQVDLEPVLRCFDLLGLAPEATDPTRCRLSIPVRRSDLEREVDLIEEFARWYGLDNVPAPAPVGVIVPEADDRHIHALYDMQHTLRSLGLTEIQNYSLLAPRLMDLFEESETTRAQREILPHPISQDQSILRTSLIPQMTETLGRNQARQIEEAAFFECGRVFLHTDDTSPPLEQTRVALGLMGPAGRQRYDKRRDVSPDEMFAWLKGLIETLIAGQHAGRMRVQPITRTFFATPYAIEIIADDSCVGIAGILEQKLAAQWRFQGPVGLAELHVPPLLQNAHTQRPINTPPAQPSIKRDVALVAGPGVRHEHILEVIRAAAPPELEHIELFDLYQGRGIEPGQKSMAYSLTYRADGKTLTDEEANAFHEAIKARLCADLAVDIR